MKSLTITLNPAQARVVISALNLYLRTQIGQLEEALWVADPGATKPISARELCRHYLEDAKMTLFGFGRNASHGILSPEVPDTARVARDIHDVIQHAVAMDERPEGGPQVWFRPVDSLSKEPLPTCEVK